MNFLILDSSFSLLLKINTVVLIINKFIYNIYYFSVQISLLLFIYILFQFTIIAIVRYFSHCHRYFFIPDNIDYFSLSFIFSSIPLKPSVKIVFIRIIINRVLSFIFPLHIHFSTVLSVCYLSCTFVFTVDQTRA
jgi:hypothetical protein